MNDIKSVVFDRAAAYYDQTRGLQEAESAQLTDALEQALGDNPAARILEIGIGTGRIGGPLHERGRALIGVDLSRPMLSVLRGKFPTLPIAVADITRLPFAPATCDGILAFHVLHLVRDWREALAEAVRVLRPGGRLIYSTNQRAHDSFNWQLRQEWQRLVEAQGESAERPGTRDDEEIGAHLRQLGARDHTFIEALQVHDIVTPRDVLEMMRQRIWSDTWLVSDAVFSATMAHLQEWAAARFDLDQACDEIHDIGFHVYTF